MGSTPDAFNDERALWAPSLHNDATSLTKPSIESACAHFGDFIDGACLSKGEAEGIEDERLPRERRANDGIRPLRELKGQPIMHASHKANRLNHHLRRRTGTV